MVVLSNGGFGGIHEKLLQALVGRGLTAGAAPGTDAAPVVNYLFGIIIVRDAEPIALAGAGGSGLDPRRTVV